MECPAPIIFRPLKPPEPTRPGDKAPGRRTLRFTSGRFRQRNVPRHAWCGGAGKRSGASARRPFSFIGQARYGNYGQPPSWSNSPTPSSTCRKPTATSESRTRGTPPMGVVARPVPPHPPRHPARRKRSPLAAGHPRFSFGPSGYAGLIIPASWNPSTPCRAHTVAPLMTEPILAGNASLDQTVQKKKSRTGIS